MNEQFSFFEEFARCELTPRKEGEMNIDEMFPSKFLRKSDIPAGKSVKVTIRAIQLEHMDDDHGGEEKPVMYFQDKAKGMVLNRTNANMLGALFGKETDDWCGQEVVIWHDASVQMAGQAVGGLRIQPPAAGLEDTPF